MAAFLFMAGPRSEDLIGDSSGGIEQESSGIVLQNRPFSSQGTHKKQWRSPERFAARRSKPSCDVGRVNVSQRRFGRSFLGCVLPDGGLFLSGEGSSHEPD
jgi:hypothetical protein